MKKNGAAPTAVSPPSGTGFTAGLGESFSLDLNSGQGTFTLPFDLPGGVAGHRPRVALEYVHGQGDGPFGLGWRLKSREITRRLDLGGPDGDAREVFLDGATELRARADGRFVAVREAAFTRYERAGAGWVLHEKDGRREVLGETPAARVVDPERPDRPVAWRIERSEDASGNAIHHEYDTRDGWSYPSAVIYAAFTVRFVYEDRPDVVRDGRGGFPRRLTRRCQEITAEVTATGEVFRRLALGYEQAPGTGRSMLTAATLSAHRAGRPDVRRNPVRLAYSAFDPDAISVRLIEAKGGAAPPALDDPEVALLALDDLPLPGILANVNGRMTYWGNTGRGAWAPPRPLEATPQVRAFGAEGVQFLDMDGTGRADMVVGIGTNPLNGHYENRGAEGFGGFVPRPRTARASPPLASPRLRIADTDGDGRIDAVHSQGRGLVVHRNRGRAGWAEPAIAPAPDGATLADPLTLFADMTGDGRPDLVRIRSGEVTYWPTLGEGRRGEAVRMESSPRLGGLHRAPGEVHLIDVVGDGCADLVRIGPGGIELYVNRAGQGFAAPLRHAVIPGPIPGTVRPVDLDGTGRVGLIYATRRGRGIAHVHVALGGAERAHLLRGIDNGMGLETEISYAPMTQMALRDRDEGRPWRTSMPFPLWIVSATEERDRVTGRAGRVEYRYRDGHFDPLFRRFQGFAEVDRIERGDASRPDTLTRHRFLTGQAAVPGATRAHAHLDRLLAEVAVFQLDGTEAEGRPLKSEETNYAVEALETLPDGTERVFIAVERTRRIFLERTDDRRIEERILEHDAFGNVIAEVMLGRGTRNGAPVPELHVRTEIDHASNAGRTAFKPARTVKRDAGGAILMEERRLYDGLPLGALSRGLCTREEHLVLPEAEYDAHYAGMDDLALGHVRQPDADGTPCVFALHAERRHTPQGTIAEDRTGAGRETVKVYDPSGMHLVGETVNGKPTRRMPDPVHGKPLELVSASGAVVRLRYDAFGRLTHVLLADDAPETATRIFTYDDASVPASMTTSHRIGPSDRTRTRTYYDGQAKEVQRRAERAPREVVVSGWSVRGAAGDAVEEFEPTLDATLDFAVPALAGRPSRRVRFDALGRPVASVDYGGGTSRAEHAPFHLRFWDALDDTPGHPDAPRIEEVDAWGARTLIEEAGPDGPVRTRYVTGLFGEIREQRDDVGVVASYRYDRRGNRLAVDHRDAGLREQWFDAHGDAVRTRDARGHDVAVARDPEGRVTRVSLNGTEVERFEYGDDDPGADGRLRRAVYTSGEQTFGYSARGFLTDHRIAVDGRNFAFAYDHDDMGRQVSATHPDGTVLTRAYSGNGLVTRIDGVIDVVAYDARNVPTEVRHANGVVTRYEHEPGVGHLRRQTTTGPGGAMIEDVTHDYDALMRLVRRSDAAPGGEVAEYQHDPLGQLAEARISRGGTEETFAYSHASGRNLAELGGSGWRLGYGEAARPDRMTEATRPGEAAAPVSHDANGNLEGLPGRAFDYDFKNRLTRVALEDGTVVRYDYDYRGNRIRRVVERQGVGTTTIYLGRMVEITGDRITNYALLDGRRVMMERLGARRWLHHDHLGSVSRFTDETGTPIVEIAYAPFGTERRRSGDPPLKVFALHDHDEVTGLVLMGHRWLAPETGRFLMPDPLYLHEPERADDRPVLLRLYAYAGNAPGDNVDPDGLSFWSVVGAIVGVVVGIAVAVAVVAAFASGIGFGLLAVAGLIALTTVSYVVAHNNQGTGLGEFARGFMIGMNAGLNAAFLTMLGAGALGVVIGVLGFLASIDAVASNEVYQGVIGWSNWLMPMSWLVTGVGAIFWILNGLGHLLFWSIPQLWGGGVARFRITAFRMDWSTGMLASRGGWIASMMPQNAAAFNMGNFSWAAAGNGTWAMDHEAGHNLNLAVYGAIFHYVGAIHEVPLGAGAGAFAEVQAESNAGGPGMWS